MKEFLSKLLIENKYLNLDVQGGLIILIIIIVSIVLYILEKKYRKRIEKKADKWLLLTKNASKIIRVLIGLSAVIGIFEVMGIHVANYMSTPIIKTKEILVTPSRLVLISIIVVITWAISTSLKTMFTNYIQSNKEKNFASMNVFKLVKYLLWIIAIAISLQSIGLNLTFVLAGSAALLVGVGIGMQKIFNDMISGLFLLFEQSLKINDVVEVDGIIGRVKDIGIRTSKILTRDNIEMIVPNSKFINDPVINWTYNDAKTRFFVKIGVAYGSNIDLLKEILIEITESHPLINKTPTPFIFFRDFGDSSLDFEIAFWTTHSLDNEIIKSDLRFEINRKLQENGIVIPFPQRDLHIIEK